MKKLITLFTFCIFSAICSGQKTMSTEVNFGIGIAPTLLSGVGGIPISVSVDHPLESVENFTVGGYVGYFFGNQTLGGGITNYKIKYSVIIIGARGTYHLTDLIDDEKIDPYVGAMLGYNIVSSKLDGGNLPLGIGSVASSGIGWAGLIGAKYSVSDALKVFGEVGYGISVITLGASFGISL